MKLDLKKDRDELRDYLMKRFREYSAEDNVGPGEAGDLIRLITVGYYADQGGYVNLVFDTREEAEVDGEWTTHIDNEENTCEFPHWTDACEEVYEGGQVEVTRHDGVRVTLSESLDDEELQAVFGDMIVSLVTEFRDDGTLSMLPLSPDAFIVVEEFDGQFFWPTYETRKTEGRIAK